MCAVQPESSVGGAHPAIPVVTGDGRYTCLRQPGKTYIPRTVDTVLPRACFLSATCRAVEESRSQISFPLDSDQ